MVDIYFHYDGGQIVFVRWGNVPRVGDYVDIKGNLRPVDVVSWEEGQIGSGIPRVNVLLGAAREK